MGSSVLTLPTDLLVEIFSYMKKKYFEFRLINKSCNRAIISWDGWDALIDQGLHVEITRDHTRWYKVERTFRPILCRINHRGGDLPAYEGVNGNKEWWVNGERHRDNDLPALEDADGSKEWWYRGWPVRLTGKPCLIGPDGEEETFDQKLKRLYS